MADADRVRELENQVVEFGSILDWISDVLEGKDVGEFAESFSLVRQVMNLRAERDVLADENRELRKDITIWCAGRDGNKLCAKAAKYRVSWQDREVYVCEAHMDQARYWAANDADGRIDDPYVDHLDQHPRAFDEWPGPGERTLW